MQIRLITCADLAAVKEVFIRSVHETAIHDYTPEQCRAWTANAEKPGWSGRFLSTWTIGAFCDDRLAGFANLDSPTRLDCFYVNPDFQRQGIGTALLKAVVAHARTQGASFLESDISLTAEPFFLAHGWQILRRNEVQRKDQLLSNATMRVQLSLLSH